VLAGIDKSSYFRGDCGIVNYKKKHDCERYKTVNLSSQFGLPKDSFIRFLSGVCPTYKPKVPWYPVLLIKEKETITATVKRCGATFINKFWVLTAGHCICNEIMKCSIKKTGVIAPDYNFTAALFVMHPTTHIPQTWNPHFSVVEIVMHPKYKFNHAYDFALLRLDYPVADNLYGIGLYSQFSDDLRPICIPHPETIPDDIEKIATSVVMGNIQGGKTCLTNGKGPEPFAPCAEKWMLGEG